MIEAKGPEPEVCVLMPTYNHAKFISQAIDGVLGQRTNFPIRLYISDDGSSDDTTDICFNYQEKFPDRIELVYSHENTRGKIVQSLYYRGAANRSKYIAFCEGDDYWTDPHKLQKQFDFMKVHPECAGCFHDAPYVNENGDIVRASVKPLLNGNLFLNEKDVFSLCGLEPTCSMFFRREVLDPFPNIMRELPSDFFLGLSIARKGLYAYLDEVMAVHVKHPEGWSSRSKVDIHMDMLERPFALMQSDYYREKFRKETIKLYRTRKYSENIGETFGKNNILTPLIQIYEKHLSFLSSRSLYDQLFFRLSFETILAKRRVVLGIRNYKIYSPLAVQKRINDLLIKISSEEQTQLESIFNDEIMELKQACHIKRCKDQYLSYRPNSGGDNLERCKKHLHHLLTMRMPDAWKLPIEKLTYEIITSKCHVINKLLKNIMLYEDYNTLRIHQAYLLKELGYGQEAYEMVIGALKKAPGHLGLQQTKGVLLASFGRYGEAISVFENNLEHTPERIDILINISDVYKYANDVEQAIHALKKFVDLGGDNKKIEAKLKHLKQKITSKKIRAKLEKPQKGFYSTLFSEK